MAQLRARFTPLLALPQPKWLLELGAFFLRTETELLLKSRRVVPTRLLREGFKFRYPGITSALLQLLGGSGHRELQEAAPPLTQPLM
jgi:NAD dependent epimerase/dehydratase family enzyme